jgi:hypothetical protein
LPEQDAEFCNVAAEAVIDLFGKSLDLKALHSRADAAGEKLLGAFQKIAKTAAIKPAKETRCFDVTFHDGKTRDLAIECGFDSASPYRMVHLGDKSFTLEGMANVWLSQVIFRF